MFEGASAYRQRLTPVPLLRVHGGEIIMRLGAARIHFQSTAGVGFRELESLQPQRQRGGTVESVFAPGRLLQNGLVGRQGVIEAAVSPQGVGAAFLSR